MLDNVKMVHQLSVEEKIRMVVSDKKNHNNDVSNYELPIISLEDNFLLGDLDFPISYQEVLRSWNPTNFQKYGRIFGKNYISKRKNCFLRVDLDEKVDNLTEDSFFIAKYLNHFIKGLNLSNCNACLDVHDLSNKDLFNKEYKSIPYEKVITDEDTQFVRVDSLKDIEYINDELCAKLNYFANCSTTTEVVKFINNGASLIFFDGDLNVLIEELNKRIVGYDEAEAELKNNQITAMEFASKINDGEILSIEQLDAACDRLINILISVLNAKEENETKLTRDDNVDGYIEQADDKVMVGNMLRETIVLLKNDDQLLPVNRERKVAFIGDLVKNQTYYHNDNDKTIIEEAPTYEEINCVGYAHGYLKEMANDEEVLNAAIKLLNTSDLGVYFMAADKDSVIPQEQIEALKAIKSKSDKPIALVIFAKEVPDMDFESLCTSIIFAGELKEGSAKAILDILAGRYNPSARLPYDVPMMKADNLSNQGLPLYTNDNIIEKYEFGYGMSYTTFEYSNMEISQKGVSFTIFNSGDYDGEEVCQLYVERVKGNSISSKRLLKGFEKVFIKKDEGTHVFIPFDEFTFRYYDEEKGCYGIEGGNYTLYIGNSSKIVRLQGGIDLSKSIDERYDFKNNVIETDVSEEKAMDFIQPKTKNPFKKKVIASSILTGYLDIALIAFVLIQIFDYFNIGIIVTLAVLLVAVNTLFALYIVKCKKESRNFIYTDENATLTNIIDSIDEYAIVEKKKYEKPAPKKVAEETKVQEAENSENKESQQTEENANEQESNEAETSELLDDGTEEVEEELFDINEETLSQEEIKQHEEEEILLMEKQNSSDNEEFVDYEEDVTFNDNLSLQQVCESFYNFTRERGLIVEYISVRSIFSALAASRIVFMTSKMKDLLPRLTVLLNEFLGNKTHITETKPTWNSSFYLTWRKNEEGNYVKTDFVNDVYNANRLKNNLSISILNNVNMSNIELYFNEFIDYANRPSYHHEMKLNNNQNIRIPNNISFILIPENDEELDKMPVDLALASVTIEVFMREEKGVEEPIVPETISYSYFEDLVYYSKKDHFINEASWKKIDEFIEELNKLEEFEIGNKTVIQIERYTSIYIAAGGDEQEALDSVIADKLVPLIKNLKIYHQENGIKTIASLFEKFFGLENISKTIRALHRNEPIQE